MIGIAAIIGVAILKARGNHRQVVFPEEPTGWRIHRIRDATVDMNLKWR